ncbi:hypothetical protein [Flavobacterium sp.]|uniref:hypothetical protein n=1 Tax=Flavobacterium sp. TaxID=239 RepID=UPI003D6A4415
MNTIKDEADLRKELAAIDIKINQQNDKKIKLFLEAIGLQEKELPKEYLKWKTILIVVPNKHISSELKQYRFSISRIAFTTNNNAEKIHIYDQEEWKETFRNKTQLQIRNLLKTTFGGIKKVPSD